MSRTKTYNGVKYELIASTKDYRDKEPQPIKEVIAKSISDLNIYGSKKWEKLRWKK
jgi:hypothetical protein